MSDRPHHEEDDDQVEHVDEKWLVSYADMMTLLFGLFVMLFSIASQYKGNYEEQLQKISFDKENPATPPTSENTVPAQQFEDLKIQLDNLKKESSSLRENLSQKANEQETLRKNLDEALLKIEHQTLALDKAKSKPIEKIKKLDETPELKLKLSESEKKIQKLKEELQAQDKKRLDSLSELQKLKNEIEIQKNENIKAQRKIASISDQKADAHLKDEERVKELEQKNLKLIEKQQEYEKQIEALKKEGESQAQFLFVILKWSSEKHDLDLTVTDPKGKTFNFKSRKFAGHPGEFTLDSRSGPGAEIWQTNKIVPGIYKISWKLYNTYGNDKPVVFSGFISSNRGNILISESTFEAKVGSQKALQVEVDSKGNIRQL